jgi:hypothetical protein
MGAPDSFPDEVKLSCGNHVFDTGNVVEDVLNCGVLYPLLFHTCYVDGWDTSDASMQEDFKLVKKALPQRPHFAAP